MNLYYDETINAFVYFPDDNTLQSTWYDADTLRELSYHEVTSRGNEIFDRGLRS